MSEQNKPITALTDEDRRELSNVVYDLETGNHLLRPRSLSYKALVCYVNRIKVDGPTTDVDREILDYIDACYSPDALKKYNAKYLGDVERLND